MLASCLRTKCSKNSKSSNVYRKRKPRNSRRMLQELRDMPLPKLKNWRSRLLMKKLLLRQKKQKMKGKRLRPPRRKPTKRRSKQKS